MSDFQSLRGFLEEQREQLAQLAAWAGNRSRP